MKLGKLIAQALDLWTQCPGLVLNQSNWIAEKLLNSGPRMRQGIIDELALQPKNSADEITPGEILECPSCHATGRAEIFRR